MLCPFNRLAPPARQQNADVSPYPQWCIAHLYRDLVDTGGHCTSHPQLPHLHRHPSVFTMEILSVYLVLLGAWCIHLTQPVACFQRIKTPIIGTTSFPSRPPQTPTEWQTYVTFQLRWCLPLVQTDISSNFSKHTSEKTWCQTMERWGDKDD